MGPSFVMAALAGLSCGSRHRQQSHQQVSLFRFFRFHLPLWRHHLPVAGTLVRFLRAGVFFTRGVGNLASFSLLWYSERH